MFPVLVVFPLLAYILVIRVQYVSRPDHGLAGALVDAHVFVFLYVAITTELLSLLDAVDWINVLAAWLVLLVACVARLIQSGYPLMPIRVHHLRGWFDSHEPFARYSIVTILTLTLFTGLVYPPNTNDSMTYHMARIMHWMQNRSVDFYEASSNRQNYMMPLAEFAIMHLQLITGRDWFANSVQWLSMVVSLSAVFLISAELKLSRRQQYMALLVTAATPMAIMQSSSTQNDLVVSAFILVFAWYLLRLAGNVTSRSLFMAAAAMGLALMTKGTAYIYCAVIGIVLSFPVVMRHGKVVGYLRVALLLLVIPVLGLLVTSGHLWRNFQLYGHPLTTETRHKNQVMNVDVLVANVVRNSVVHLVTPLDAGNRAIQQWVFDMLEDEAEARHSTFTTTRFRLFNAYHEDLAANLPQFLLLCLSLLMFPWLWYRNRYRHLFLYFSALVLSGLLFSILLKWQPWTSRLQTPLFLYAAPVMAIVLDTLINRVRHVDYRWFLAALLIWTTPYLFMNKTRSLVSLDWLGKTRDSLYFRNRTFLYKDYRDVVNDLRQIQPGEAGLYFAGNDYEYPLWVLAGQETPFRQRDQYIRFRPIAVNNLSARLAPGDVDLPKWLLVGDRAKYEDFRYKDVYEPFRLYTTIGLYRKRQSPDGVEPLPQAGPFHSTHRLR